MIEQLNNDLGYCPHCGAGNDWHTCNGDVDVPPIPQQMIDKKHGLEREFLARRYYCQKCYALWDVIVTNRVTGMKLKGKAWQ